MQFPCSCIVLPLQVDKEKVIKFVNDWPFNDAYTYQNEENEHEIFSEVSMPSPSDKSQTGHWFCLLLVNQDAIMCPETKQINH